MLIETEYQNYVTRRPNQSFYLNKEAYQSIGQTQGAPEKDF